MLKSGVLVLAMVLLSGCYDSITLDFEKSVDNPEHVEKEITQALEGKASISQFYWYNNDLTTIKLRTHFGYSSDELADHLEAQFGYQENPVTLLVTINETHPPILESTGFTAHEVITAKLAWSQAQSGAFFSERSSYGRSKTFVDREFYCGIEVPLATPIPSLHLASRHGGKPKTLDNAPHLGIRFEIDNQKSIDGLTLKKGDYEIAYFEDEEKIFLLFKNMGRKDYQYSSLPKIVGINTPRNTSDDECRELILDNTGNDLFGALLERTAKNNVANIKINAGR